MRGIHLSLVLIGATTWVTACLAGGPFRSCAGQQQSVPMTVVVHVAKPEVIEETCEECPEDNCQRETKQRMGLFKQKQLKAKTPSPSAPTIASILAPAPAFVPLAPAVAANSCNTPSTSHPGNSAEVAFRAAQDLALAHARFNVAVATMEAEQKASQAILSQTQSTISSLQRSDGASEAKPSASLRDLEKKISDTERAVIRLYNILKEKHKDWPELQN